MTLRQRLALRYGIVVVTCLALLAWISYHEFVEEQAMFRKLGIQEPVSTEISDLIEVLIFSGVPVTFIVGWWFVRRSLKPLDDLAASVEKFDVNNLSQRLPQTGNNDEVDRMANAFNVMAGRLEKSVAQIREFTLRASHELKTPLTVMRAQVETTLDQETSLSSAQRATLESLLEETQRLGRIVDSLTLLSKADAGVVSLEREPVNLEDLVREAVEDAEVLAQPSALSVHLLKCERGTILGDRHRLRQVLLNLMDNATKYNQPGGQVEVALSNNSNWAQLTVANSGPGVPSDVLPHVFDRFVRGPAKASSSAESCGLGLTIVKWIVEAHGGTISMTSKPGELTTVTVRLPLATY